MQPGDAGAPPAHRRMHQERPLLTARPASPGSNGTPDEAHRELHRPPLLRPMSARARARALRAGAWVLEEPGGEEMLPKRLGVRRPRRPPLTRRVLALAAVRTRPWRAARKCIYRRGSKILRIWAVVHALNRICAVCIFDCPANPGRNPTKP